MVCGYRGKKKMSFHLIVYLNLLILLIGVFGIVYSKDIISAFISLQLIVISGLMNFLVFSHFLYSYSLWDKIFIILGVTVIYLIFFCLVYYVYLSKNELDRQEIYRDFGFFKVTRNDWLGEDDI
jgi:NADH:ubiquinone oxidoreductase subunit K